MFSVLTGKLVKHIPRDNAPPACSFGKRTTRKEKKKKNAARTGGGTERRRDGPAPTHRRRSRLHARDCRRVQSCPAATVETFTRISRRGGGGAAGSVFSDSVCDSRGHVGPSAGEKNLRHTATANDEQEHCSQIQNRLNLQESQLELNCESGITLYIKKRKEKNNLPLSPLVVSLPLF